MGCVALAAPHCVRLWVKEPSLTRPDAHNPPGLGMIPWQGNEQIYWLEMNEPTYDNILSEIDRVLERRYRYRWLIGTTREGTRLLISDQGEPLLHAEMVPIQSNQGVRIWWSVNMLGEPMDLLFYGHCGSALESGTDSPLDIHFTSRHNRGPSPDASQSRDDDISDGTNPELSATGGKSAPLWKTTTT